MFFDLFLPSMIATAVVGVSCGYLSVFVVLKRLVFLAVALAQVASAAVALALMFGFNTLLAALLGVLLGGILFSWSGLGYYLPRENAIGTWYALASAAGVLLADKIAQGKQHLHHLLYGDILTVLPGEILLMCGVLLFVGVIFALFGKEFVCISFDPEMARTLGLRTRLWEGLFFLVLGLVIAIAIRLAGVMLVFALLVLPGYAALLAGCRLRGALVCSVLLALLTGAPGMYLSYRLDLPTSAVVVALLGTATLLGAVFGALRRRVTKSAAGEPSVAAFGEYCRDSLSGR